MRVLVATDGSQVARDAARRGLELLGRPADVTVLTTITDVPGEDAGGIEGPTVSSDQSEEVWAGLQQEAEAAIDATVVAMGRPEVTRLVQSGDAGGVICAAADDLHADVVVVGSHGHGLLRRVFLGSVSEYVVRHAPCAVLVVPHEARTDHE